MSKYEEILTGATVPELDLNEPVEYDALQESEINADIVDIVDHLGTEEFQFLYLNLYHEIRALDIEKQKRLCEMLEEEVSKIYNFEFEPKITIESPDDIDKFLTFIEFLEFDCVEFLTSIIPGTTAKDLLELKNNLNLFLESRWDKIDNIIYVFPENIGSKTELISKFLRTYNKEGLHKFIQMKLEKDKMLVILKIMEGELQNE